MLKKIAVASSTILLFTPLFAFGASACVTISGSLSLGSTGSQVQALQFYFTQEYAEFTRDHVTGTFDAFTESALKQWQSDHGIVSSGTPESTGWGVVGPRTRSALSCSSQSNSSSSVSTPVPTSNSGSTLSIGSTGSAVLEVQEVLIAQGLLSPDSATGYFGPLTQAAVRLFQSTNGIVTSGTPSSTGFGAVGPRTIAAIHAKQTSGGGQATQENQNTPSFGTVATPLAPVVSNAPCSIAGLSMPSGSSLVFYSQFSPPAGSDCSRFSQVRQCINGTLTGGSQYQYAACATLQNVQQCNVNGTLIQNGASLILYSQPSVSYGGSCVSISQVRTCANGAVSGSPIYQFATCSVAGAAACTVGSVSVPSGASQTFYSAKQVAFGSSCSSVAQTRACSNGIISGSNEYANDTCAPVTTSSCSLDGASVANGSSKTFYSAATVAYGTTCASVSQSRKCIGGILDGSSSYSHGSCTVAPASSCVLDGVTVASGSSHNFYAANLVAGGSCTAVSRKCTNGALNGSESAVYATCTAISAAAINTAKATINTAIATETAYKNAQDKLLSCGSAQAGDVSANSTAAQSNIAALNQLLTRLSGTSATDQRDALADLESLVGQHVLHTQTDVNSANTAAIAACAAQAAQATCTLDGATIAAGASGTFYSVSAAPAGKLCSAYDQVRTCTKGALSGTNTYKYSSCTDTASCTVATTTVPSGSSATFYSAALSGNCDAVALSRTCTNGSLSGSASYSYAACRVPRITVTSPVSGGIYNMTNSISVRWTTESPTKTVMFQLYKSGVAQGGTNVATVPDSSGGVSGYYIGQSQALGTDYTIRMKDAMTGGVAAGESPVFTIGYVTNPLTILTDKTSYIPGDTIALNIRNESGTGANVIYLYTLNNIDTNTVIASGSLDPSAWNILIPANAPSGHYQVSLKLAQNFSINNTSPTFTIGTVTASNADKLSQVASALQAIEQLIQRLRGTQ
jgi:peptidoglycan hydrolase-like protein with peptidoglycan-binding domain